MRTACLQRHSRIAQQQQRQSLGRRHGSNTPGPLEARRRTSRRKYGAAVSVTGGSSSGDIGTMLSFAPAAIGKEREWYTRERDNQRPASPSSVVEPQSVPSFGFPAIVPVPKPALPLWLNHALKDLNEVEAEARITKETPSMATLTMQWKLTLQDCTCLDDIRAGAARWSIPLSEPAFSKLAFDHLIALRPGHDAIVNFLSDRLLNPAMAYNGTMYVQRLFSRVLQANRESKSARRDLRRFRKWVVQEVWLGSMTEEEIRHTTRRSNFGSVSNAQLEELFWKLLASICDGLATSKVRPIQQLHPSTIRTILRAIASSTETCLQVRSRLAHRVIVATCVGRPELFAVLTSCFIRAFLAHESVSDLRTTGPRDVKNLEGVYQIFRISLSHLPNSKVLGAILDTLPRYDHVAATKQALQTQWLDYCLQQPEVLCLLRDSPGAEDIGPFTTKIEVLKSFVSHRTIALLMEVLSPSASVRLLSVYLRATADVAVSSFDLQTSTNAIRSLSRPQSHSLRSDTAWSGPSSKLGEALQDYLEAMPQEVVSACVNTLASIMSHLEDAAPLEHFIRFCQQRQIYVPISTVSRAVDNIAQSQPSRGLSIFLFDTRLRLEHSQNLAAAIIASPSIPTEVISSLLGRSLRYRDRRPERVYPVKGRFVSFLHKLAFMLLDSNDQLAARPATMVSDILALFQRRPGLAKPSLIQAYVRAEVRAHGNKPYEFEKRQEIRRMLEHFEGEGLGSALAMMRTEGHRL